MKQPAFVDHGKKPSLAFLRTTSLLSLVFVVIFAATALTGIGEPMPEPDFTPVNQSISVDRPAPSPRKCGGLICMDIIVEHIPTAAENPLQGTAGGTSLPSVRRVIALRYTFVAEKEQAAITNT